MGGAYIHHTKGLTPPLLCLHCGLGVEIHVFLEIKVHEEDIGAINNYAILSLNFSFDLHGIHEINKSQSVLFTISMQFGSKLVCLGKGV